MNVPVMSYGRTPEQITAFYTDAMRRITELPGVERVAVGTQIPWREAGSFGPGSSFRSRATRKPTAKRIRERDSVLSRRIFCIGWRPAARRP
jgi:hypothetical protein